MADLRLEWAGDLSISSTGDLALVVDPQLGTQRVIRRLMTNPDDYVWHAEYGAGLGQFVGQATDPAAIKATIRSQMSLEAAVSQIVEPLIAVSSDPTGSYYLEIQYQDSATAQASPMTIELSK